MIFKEKKGRIILSLANQSYMTMMKSVPNRPAISDILIKASANATFCDRLLANPEEVITEMNLPPEDEEILKEVRAGTLKEYAFQIKMKLLLNYR